MDKVDLSDDIDDTLTLPCRIINKPELCRDLLAKHDFKVLTCNIRSSHKNFPELVTMLHRLDSHFDVIVLTECWLNDNSIVNQLPGYNCFHTRKVINKSGGVTVYVKDTWPVSVVEPEFDDANCLVTNINKSITVLGIYRSPSFNNIDRFLNSLDQSLSSLNDCPCVIVTGDMNIDLLDSSPNASHIAYQCLLSEHGLLPGITEPTRGKACLDHAFIKSKGTSSTQGIVCKSSITDHDLVILGTNQLKVSGPPRNRFRQIIDYSKIAVEIGCVNWDEVLSKADVGEAVLVFNKILSDTVEKHTQKVKMSRSKFILKPWVTPGLIRCMRHRDSLHAQVKMQPLNDELKRIYVRYRNFCSSILHKRKAEYESRELEKHSVQPKRLWRVIKDICNFPKRNNDSSSLLNSGADSSSSINSCNRHFISVGKRLALNILDKLQTTESKLCSDANVESRSRNSLFLHPTNAQEIDRIITDLKDDSAPGPDGIRPLLLKHVKSSILEPLTHICNLSMSTGSFPASWKVAAVTPVYKKGAKDCPDNYRPISLLCVTSKILEKLVNRRLISFLENHNLLSGRQYGFRQGRSTEQAVGLLTDIVSSRIDGSKKSIGVFLDLAKAFDTVSVKMLLKKLECFGVRGVAWDWFCSYLSGRQQYVVIEDSVSDALPVVFGVPQGSVLGPTLFTMYVDDLLRQTIPQSEVICYADDTAIIFHGDTWRDVKDTAEKGMRTVTHWLDKNLLTLNIEKTYFIAFHISRSRCPDIDQIKIHSVLCHDSKCNCGVIDRVKSTKYLGIMVDQNLTFREHISILSKRTRKFIYIMKSLRSSASKDICRKVYLALCQSLLQYCVGVWGSAAKSHLLELERAQRAVLKVYLGKPRRFPTDELYKEAGVLRVRQLYILRSLLQLVAKMGRQFTYTQRGRVGADRLPISRVRTTLATRFSLFLPTRVFNTINKSCIRVPGNTLEAKKVLEMVTRPNV